MILGLVIAIVGGTVLEKLHMERYLEAFVRNIPSAEAEIAPLQRKDRIAFAKGQVKNTVRKVAPYIFIGVGIGALIHNIIPQSMVETVLGNRNPFSVILATLVGVPMYADIFGTVPVAEGLLAKGASLGTVLSFMMSVTTLSLPSLVMLKKIMRRELLAAFVGITVLGIMIVGYGFHMLQFTFI